MKRNLFIIVFLFFAISLLTYGQSLGNGFVRWDDGMLIYENPAVRQISPSTIAHVFSTYDPELYIPLTFISYQIDYAIGGTNPSIYHVTNLFLHTVNALLVSLIAFLLLRGRGIALFIGLLFLLHPLHTEAVAWASARKDVLSTFFFLLSIALYLRYQEWGDRKTYLWSLVTFALGLLSKVMVATLPVVLLLIDFLRGRRIDRSTLLEKLPYVGLSILFGIIAIAGKTSVVASSTLTAKVLMAAKSTMFYLQQIFFPLHFSVLYPYTGTITPTSPDFFIPLIVLLVLSVLAILSLKFTRVFLFALLFYILTLAPTFLNFAKGGDLDIYFASDRYAYIPSIGVFFALGAALSLLFARSSFPRRSAQVAASLLLIVLASLSFRQSLTWKDTEALFGNVLAYYPDASHVAHNNLGNMYRLRGDLDRSIAEYEQAIAIRPHAKTLSNLGAAYRRKGMMAQALDAYERALTLDPASPFAHFGMGILADAQGRLDDARASYMRAIAVDPTYEEVYVNLGSLSLKEGKLEEAVSWYERALKIQPYYADARYNLAIAYARQGRAEEAIQQYEEVVFLSPHTIAARINLGLLYHQTGNTDAARRQFEEILLIDPSNKSAKMALQQMGE